DRRRHALRADRRAQPTADPDAGRRLRPAPATPGGRLVSLPVTVATGEAPKARRYVSLRLRLLAMVLLVLVPWLALVLYMQADERKVAIADVGDDAMRLVHIVTSNQAAQVEAARQLLLALARLPQL